MSRVRPPSPAFDRPGVTRRRALSLLNGGHGGSCQVGSPLPGGLETAVIRPMNFPPASRIASMLVLLGSLTLAAQQPPKTDLGLFEEHADVGNPAKAGSV